MSSFLLPATVSSWELGGEVCALEMLLVSHVMPASCGTGSDEAARLGRAAGGALLRWDHCAVFNAMRRCQRSRGPSLGARSGRVLVLLQLFSPKVRGCRPERKRL